MTSVVLADDEPLVRAGVRAILTTDPAIRVVAEAGDGHQAVELVYRYRPDVALLDIRMPRLDGLSAAEQIVQAGAGTAVVLLTTFGEDTYIQRALSAGASGFLLKTGDPRELLVAVHSVAEGAAFLSPRVAARVIAALNADRLGRAADARERVQALSGREREVLALLGAGLTNAEIGQRLFLVEGTVKAYVSAALARLGVRNRVQAAVLAFQAGLVDGDSGVPPP